jgi:hypothetical protein
MHHSGENHVPTRRATKSKPPEPSSLEQSGSAGRKSADTDKLKHGDTGQDRYGQSGFAGNDDVARKRTNSKGARR